MKTRKIIVLSLVLLVCACATYKPQYRGNNSAVSPQNKKISHEFYLIGDAGLTKAESGNPTLQAFKEILEKASENSTAIFLGDNIYPAGLPEKGAKDRGTAEQYLNNQINTLKNFKGNPIFIPGNHDWYSNGLKGLKRQEKWVEDALGKHTFLPQNGCPIEKENINDDLVLLLIDSQWFIEDWDKHPTINDECEIKTREQFFEEVESQINKAQGKTLVIAMHHPIVTNGSHGGNYSFESYLSPTPVLGSIKNYVRNAGGVSPQDLQSVQYRTLSKRLLTLAQQSKNIIFVSGHEHSLQYIVNSNIPFIISGSGSKKTATKLGNDGLFTYAENGFVKMVSYTDGSVHAYYYAAKNNYSDPVFNVEVIAPDKEITLKEYPNTFAPTSSGSVYTKEETSKGGLFRALWGKHYRKEYSKQIKARTVSLDTLFGGLEPVRKGGGHQSKSLRLVSKDGKEYVMRAVRKSAIRFLQAVAFKDQFIQEDFKDTYSERLLLDFYTTAHPYASLTVGTLADAIEVLHANPALYYVPKQNALNIYNDTYGDELYFIEERVDSGHGDLASFGFSNEVISTKDLLLKLRKKDKNSVDERQYIRSRLFDMLLGDWDRHEDQWRWAEFKDEAGKNIYKPIPRDRDQVFSDFDGFFLSYFTRTVPGLRLFQRYQPKMRSVKWFNEEPFPLDLAVLDEHTLNDWLEEVNFIQERLTDQVVDQAFANFPQEMDAKIISDIKASFKGRKANLKKIATTYYNYLKKNPIISGTDKDDYFEIERMPKGKTRVRAFRIKEGVKGDQFLEITYHKKETNQIWIYGLDDDDVFEVKGKGNGLIKIKIIGGQNNDVYKIENRRRVKVYDFKSKKNTFETPVSKKLSDKYALNVYDHKKVRKSVNQLLPNIGFNPDDGIKLGLQNTFTTHGLNENPFTQQHRLAVGYFFATQGYDLRYNGEFANFIGAWNLGIEGVYTSPNFAINFFGFGNESTNNDDLFTFDFNRVKIINIRVAPKLIWRGKRGGSFSVGGAYESIEVDNTEGRFISTAAAGVEASIFDAQNFLGAEVAYSYENFNDRANPTSGLGFEFTAGYKTNIDNSNDFGYLIPSLRYTTHFDNRGILVLATKIRGHINIGNDFEFYQGASIGGTNGLRGFRNQRFVGKNSFYQNTDLRLNLAKFRTGLFPLKFGILGGFDYGRVWLQDDNSGIWHNSVGGGVFFNAAGLFNANFALFNSDDFNRFVFALGFNF